MSVAEPNIRLSIVLPCYNPLNNWLDTVAKYYAEVLQVEPNTELIIVNDGSTKEVNAETVKQKLSAFSNVRYISYAANFGKGHALRRGVMETKGSLIIFTDIDFPYTTESFKTIYKVLTDGADVAIGIRNREYYTHLPKARVYISKFLRFLIRKTLRIPTDDTQCGLKGFNLVGRQIFLVTSIQRYLFDLEFIYLAARAKLNIQTRTVNLRDDVQLSHMNWKVLLQEGGNFLKIFFRAF
jgi:glycosyltransferase involved in cell wall biosynthesis